MIHAIINRGNRLLWSQFLKYLLLTCLCLAPATQAATYLGTTTLYQGGDSARRIDIVYVPVGFDSSNLSTFINIVSQSSQFISLRSPFTDYQTFFNIHRMDAYSALNETDAVRSLAVQNVPDTDVVIFVKFESGTAYSYFGGDVVLYSSGSASETPEVAAHELGHVIGYLADEYVSAVYCPSGAYAGPEPAQLNATINTDRSTLKWRAWLGVDGVDLFQGAWYCPAGAYRPRNTCAMSTLQDPHFDPVCREGLSFNIFNRVNPFVTQNPDTTALMGVPPQPVTLSVAPDASLRPQGAAIQQYKWYVDGNLQPGVSGTSFTLDLGTLLPNMAHTAQVFALDPDVNDYIRINTSSGPGVQPGVSWSINVVKSPTISSFSPSNGGADTTVTITGTNFTGATAISFNGVLASFSVMSATQIQAIVPGYYSATGPITVTTPSGSVSSMQVFTLSPVVTISSISVNEGFVGDWVSVYGGDFCSAQCNTNYPTETSVAVNGVVATPFYMEHNWILFQIPSGASTGPITVTAPGGTATSAASLIVYQPPTVTKLNQAGGKVGDEVAIAGTNFCYLQCNTNASTETQVKVNGVVATITWIQPKYLRFRIPVGATTGPITVTALGGTATSAVNLIVYQPPTITKLNKAGGKVGDEVAIQGMNFCYLQCGASASTETKVKVNGVVATITWIQSNYLRFRIPVGATTGPITVTALGGTATSAVNLIVYQPPTITSFTPTLGGPSTTVTITGNNFTGTTAISFIGVSAQFSVISATQIQAVVPSSATTGPISISTPGGTATSTQVFTVTP